MDKSVVVTVERRVMHPKYGKFVKRSQQVHGARRKGEAMWATRCASWKPAPSASCKRWRVVEVVERAK
jgi:small subunit ribosomal protein S17